MKITILHTESSLGWGGQENRTLNELSELQLRGYNPLLVCQPQSKLGTKAKAIGCRTIDISMDNAFDLRTVWALRQVIKKNKVTIVNTHSGRDTQLAGLAARSIYHRRPCVVRTRHLALPISSRLTYTTLPDHIVAVSRHVARYLASIGISDTKISTVPTGIDLSHYHAEKNPNMLRNELGIDNESPLIGTVAILRRKKGHADLLEAIPHVLEKFPTAHFVFVGDGPQLKNLSKQIIELGLANNVHLLGLRHDVVNILASLDLFVLPTHQEALGTVFIEAAAMGVPVIASNIDGVPEVVRDGETGLLVPVGDIDAIAKNINYLLANPLIRHNMGAMARAKINTYHSRQVMVDCMLSVYEKIISYQ